MTPDTDKKEVFAPRTGRKQHIIVIGASAGGFDALATIFRHLNPVITAPIFIVWHMPVDGIGVLPTVLNKITSIYAAHAIDGETITTNRIYVAPPNSHMLVEQGRVKLSTGPKENRFRPAIDPLFRSAAVAYKKAVVGVILSGGLNDGTAGLMKIKELGGTAIIQTPEDAEVSSMPLNALRHVQIDYQASAADMGKLLYSLCLEEPPPGDNAFIEEPVPLQKMGRQASINKASPSAASDPESYPSLRCPACSGRLSKITKQTGSVFACDAGHTYSADSLLTAIRNKIEDNISRTIQLMDESILLLYDAGDNFSEANYPLLASRYFQRAIDTGKHMDLLRTLLIEYRDNAHQDDMATRAIREHEKR